MCVGAYTAAGIAGSDPNKTAFTSIKLALAGFIVPFVFIYSPEIMLTNVVSLACDHLCHNHRIDRRVRPSIATEGYIAAPVPFWGRLLAFAGAVLLIFPGVVTDATGFSLLGLVIFYT